MRKYYRVWIDGCEITEHEITGETEHFYEIIGVWGEPDTVLKSNIYTFTDERKAIQCAIERCENYIKYCREQCEKENAYIYNKWIEQHIELIYKYQQRLRVLDE